MKTSLLTIASLTLRAAGGPAPLVTPPAITGHSGAVSFINALFSGAQRVDTEVESLTSDDVNVWRSSLIYEQRRGDWKTTATLAGTWLEIDYEPTIVTFPSHRTEQTPEGALEFSRRIGAWEISLGGRLYDGFPDYRALWISEYYDQFVGFLPGYETAAPRGAAATLGGSWEYSPRAGKLSAALSMGRDHIVPAWSALGTEVTRTRDVLDTFSATLLWEAALHPRFRMEHALRTVNVTNRDLRTQFQSEAAWFLTDTLTLRAHAGSAREQPDFTAWFGGASLEWQFAPSWHAGLAARLYKDNGELDSSNFNAAAPGVSTMELAVSLLWQHESTSIRLSAGHYETRYDALSDDNLFFGNLYRNRDFITARLACTCYF